MSEQLIEVKFKSTGQLGFSRERIAYRQFLEGIADISANATIVGAKDEEEESEIRMTIRSLLELRQKVPHGKALTYADKFEEAEQQLKKILQEEFFGDAAWGHVYQDDICKWLHEKHPELHLSDETIKRRLRSIRAKGGLETDGNGHYWSAEAIRRVIA